MKLSLQKLFRRHFPSVFEMYIIGTVLLLFSLPGIGLIFVHDDQIFPKMITDLRGLGVALGVATGSLGLLLLFFAVRDSAPAGSLAFRLTHPRMRRRS